MFLIVHARGTIFPSSSCCPLFLVIILNTVTPGGSYQNSHSVMTRSKFLHLKRWGKQKWHRFTLCVGLGIYEGSWKGCPQGHAILSYPRVQIQRRTSSWALHLTASLHPFIPTSCPDLSLPPGKSYRLTGNFPGRSCNADCLVL